jgi:hypothetical protein
MRTALYALLKVERGEGAKVLQFALLAAVLQAGLAVGTGAADSLFLLGVGPGGLPIVYLLTPAILLVYIPCYSYLTRRLGMRRLLRVTVGLLVVGGLGVAALLTAWPGAPPTWVLYTTKLYTGLWFVAQYSVYWNFTDEYFDILDSKRLFPLLSSGSAIGAMTGGVLLSELSGRVPTALLFTLWAGLAAGAMPLAILIQRRYRAAATGADVDDEPRLLEVFGTIGSAMTGSRHVRLFVVVSFMSFLTAAVCEFQYMTLFSQGRSEADLTALFGRMFIAVSAFNLLFGLLFFNRLVLRLGVPNMALVQPGAFLVTFAFLLVDPGFEAAVLGFFAYQGLMPAVTYDTHNLLLNAAPPNVKSHVRTFVDGLAEPGAVAISGLFLLLGAAALGTERISVIGFSMAAVYVLLVLFMRSGYTVAMVQNLRRSWLDLASPPSHLLSGLRGADLAFLQDAARSADADEVRAAIDVLWRNDKRAAVLALLAFLERASAEQRRAAQGLFAQALDDGDPEVVRPIIEWVRARELRDLGAALVEELGVRGLVQADQARSLARAGTPQEQAAASIALLNSGVVDEGMDGLAIVRRLLGSETGTAAGVRALGFSGGAAYAHTVAPFARHASPQVRREALGALRRLASPEHHVLSGVALTAAREGTPEERIEAMDVLARIGDPAALPRLLAAADRFTPLERRRAEAAILQFGPQSVPVLVSVLRDRTCPFAGRSVAARALGRLSLPQLDLLSASLIGEEVEHAYGGVWRWSLLEQAPSTPGMEVLKRYYLDVRREVLEFVLQVLAVSGRLPNYELLSASLASDSRKERGDAIETIEQGVPRSVFRSLLPLVDDRPPAAQAAYYAHAHAPEQLTPMQVLEAALQGTRLERLIAAQALCDTGADGVTLLRRRLDALDPDVAAEAFAAITRDTRRAPLTHVEKMFHLRRTHFFSRLRVQESHVIATFVADRHVPDGQAFFGRGDFADTMYGIVEGGVDLTGAAGAARRSTGEVFGEAALGGEFLRSEDAVSRGARVLVVPTARLLLEARNHPRIAAAIFRNALAASAAGASTA